MASASAPADVPPIASMVSRPSALTASSAIPANHLRNSNLFLAVFGLLNAGACWVLKECVEKSSKDASEARLKTAFAEDEFLIKLDAAKYELADKKVTMIRLADRQRDMESSLVWVRVIGRLMAKEKMRPAHGRPRLEPSRGIFFWYGWLHIRSSASNATLWLTNPPLGQQISQTAYELVERMLVDLLKWRSEQLIPCAYRHRTPWVN